MEIFALDFEGNAREGILEFGVVQLVADGLANPRDGFCHCGREPSIFLHQRKIPDDILASAPPIQGHFPLFKGMRQAGIFAAHHHGVEDSLLRRTWPSPGFVPDWLSDSPGRFVTTWGPWMDSKVLAQRLLPRLGDHSLGATLRACRLLDEWERWGEKFCKSDRRKRHCALYDAIGCALLLRHFLLRLPPRRLILESLSQIQKQSAKQRELPLFQAPPPHGEG